MFVVIFFFFMIQRPPRSTRTDTVPTRRSADLPDGPVFYRVSEACVHSSDSPDFRWLLRWLCLPFTSQGPPEVRPPPMECGSAQRVRTVPAPRAGRRAFHILAT